MLRLLKNSRSLDIYSDYYESFAKTRQTVEKYEDRNDFVKIARDVKPSEFISVDGRKLLTTRNDNLLPFEDDTKVRDARKSIFSVQKFDRWNESKSTLRDIAIGLSNWMYYVMKSITSMRLMVIDLSSKTTGQERGDMEVEMTMASTFSRGELFHAPSRVFVNVALKAIEYLKIRLKKEPISLKDSSKVIFHFGDTMFSPMLVSFLQTESEIKVESVDPYYVTHQDQQKNDWMARYSFSHDNTGLFADLISRQENYRWKEILFYTFDPSCFATLCRLALERSDASIRVYFLDEDGETIFADAKMLQGLLFHVMSSQFGLPGKTRDYLSDVYAMEILSEFYGDIDSLLEVYRDTRGSSPIYSVNWLTDLLVKDSAQAAETFAGIIKSRIDSVSLTKKKLGLTLLMADLSVIMETPIPVTDSPLTGTGRDRWRDRVLTSMRMWLSFQFVLFDSHSENRIESRFYQSKKLLFLSYALINLYPHLKKMWGDSIAIIGDVIDFVNKSKEMHASQTRAILTPLGYKLMFEEEIKRSEMDDDGDGVDEDDHEFNEEIDYRGDLEDFLRKYDQYWNEIVWDSENLNADFIQDYSVIVHDILRPMFSFMGRKRLQYMEQQGLIAATKRGIRLNLDEIWNGSISDIVINRILYQIARKFPHSWIYWNGSSASEMDRKTYEEIVTRATESWRKGSKVSKIPDSDTKSMNDHRYINPMFQWRVLPLDVSAEIATSLGFTVRTAEGWKSNSDSRRWKILKSIVPSRMKRVLPPTSGLTVKRENHSLTFAKTEIDYSLLSGWAYKFNRIAVSLQRPSVQYIRDYFHPILPEIMRDLFLIGIPSDNVAQHDNASLSSIPLWNNCQVQSKLLDVVLGMEMFSTRENFTIYDLSGLLKILMACQMTWNSALQGSVTNLMLLIRLMIYDPAFIGRENLKKNIAMLKEDRDTNELTGQIMVKLANTLGVMIPANIGVLIKTKVGARQILDSLIEETGLGNIINLFTFIMEAIVTSALWSTKSPKKIVDFMIRVFQLVDLLIVKRRKQSGQAYEVTVEFSFDIYQPRFRKNNSTSPPSPAHTSYLIMRLYQIENLASVTVDDQRDSRFLDFDTNTVSLDKYIQNSAGIPPENYIIVRDPIDRKNYQCLAWDYSSFISKVVSPLESLFYRNNIQIPNSEENFIGLLEIYAARWWLSVPEYRAKIHSRALAVETVSKWNSSRWMMWLLAANAENKLEAEMMLDPLVQSANRFKCFQIPFDASEKPANDLMAEEFGLGFIETADYLTSVVFENNNFIHYATTREDVESFRKSVEKTEFRDHAVRRVLDMDEESIEPASAKNVFDPTFSSNAGIIAESQSRDQDSSECTLIRGFLDHTSDDTINPYRSGRISYVVRSNLQYPLLRREENTEYENISYVIGDKLRKAGSKDSERMIDIKSNQEKKYGTPNWTSFVYECTMTLRDFVRGNQPSPHVVYLRDNIPTLPYFFGIAYKFYVYSSTPREYYRMERIDLDDGFRQTEVTYEEFRSANIRDPSNLYYIVKISYDIARATPQNWIFQGVYGNSILEDRLYSLFHYAQRYMSSGELILDKRSKRTSSYIRDLMQFSDLRRKNANDFWKSNQSHVDAVTNLGGPNYIQILFRAWTGDAEAYIRELMTGSLDQNEAKSSQLFFGFTKMTTWMRLFKEMVESWYVAINLQQSFYLAPGERIEAFKQETEMITVDEFSENYILRLSSQGYQDGALAAASSPSFLLFQKGETRLLRTLRETVADIYQMLESLSLSLRDFRAFKKKNSKDLFFLINGSSLYKFLEYSFEIPTLPVFFPKSAELTERLVKELTNDEVSLTIDQNPDVVSDFNSELESLDGTHFIFISNETSIQTINTLLEQALENPKYSKEWDGDFNTIQSLRDDIKQVIDKELKYMLVSDIEINQAESHKKLIQSAPRKKLMTSVISGLISGDIKFRSSNKEYSELGIDIQTGSGDNAVLWEVIEDKLSDEQLHLFNDPQSNDAEIKRLQKEIQSKKFKGFALQAKKNALEKIKRELEEGRLVMLYLNETEISQPLQDDGLIRLIYNIFDSRDGGGKVKKINQAGSNKFEIEKNIRSDVDDKLKKYNLLLLFTGEYATQGDGDVIPHKDIRYKYDEGLTIYITPDKKKKGNIKSSATFVESLIIALWYNLRRDQLTEHQRMKYYMKYHNFDDIRDQYKEKIKLRRVKDGQQYFILELLDLDAISQIFSDRFTSSIEKAKQAFTKVISKNLEINLRIVELTVTSTKFNIVRVENLANEFYPDDSFTISILNVSSKRRKGLTNIQFFEPLIDI